MILADTFKAIFATAGLGLSRSNTLISITTLILLPLCLLKNLSSLAPFSLLGTFGMAYTAVAMGFRYYTKVNSHEKLYYLCQYFFILKFLKSYALPGGKFLADVPNALLPSFGTTGAIGVFSPSAFILICMLSTAYMAHFNAPKFYIELENNTLQRYNKVVSTSFAVSIAIFVIMASLGFLTFGAGSSGLILNNYSNNDVLMGISRIAVAVSLVFR